uniref:ATP synthase subunit a n=1 Tax=Oxymonacanthus longirostris TaxID=303724 RepID=B7ZHP2_9TELE|nr:ATP synthase F0 subunit 6 [Oxymonacanthus longirostris]BAH10413.1 ATPase subunit 6 [Oxymonacanthus longirostris]
MTLSFFDQFMSPVLFAVPLSTIALVIPWALFPSTSNRWLQNRALVLQNWLISHFSHQIISPMNAMGHKWALILLSLFLYLLSLNTLGLLPYTFTPTTQLSFSLALAIPLWLATVIIGFRSAPGLSLAHLLPEGTPTPLIPILILIETASLLIRPFALGVRLTANMTAGHLLLQLIATAAYVLLPLMPAVAVLTMTLLFLLTCLEVAVAMIQAYVFVLLLSLYLQENL